MTPKEKAKELIDKMDVIHYMKLGGKNSNSKGLPISMHDSQVKQCAKIAVEEIIKQWEYIDTYLSNMNGELNPNLKYWQEVKKEIELL